MLKYGLFTCLASSGVKLPEFEILNEERGKFMFSSGNLDYKNTLQDLFTVTFNLMIIIILKIVAMAYSASLHVHITGIVTGRSLDWCFLSCSSPGLSQPSTPTPLCALAWLWKNRESGLYSAR